MIVRCGVCFREEHHDAGAVDVLVEGGRRRPAEPAFATLWAQLAPVVAGRARVVGPCAGCGAPLVVEGAGPSVAYELTTPAGALRCVDGRVIGPAGPLSPADADAFMEAAARAWRRQNWISEVRRAPAALPAFALAFGVFVAWTWAASFFFAFVQNALTSGGGMRW